MTQWNDFPIAPAPDHPPATVTEGHYVRVITTIHGLMTAWAAGPSRSFRVHVPIADRDPVRVTSTNPRTGRREHRFVPFTQDDQDYIDESVNFGLRQAGIPDIPPRIRLVCPCSSTDHRRQRTRRRPPGKELDNRQPPRGTNHRPPLQRPRIQPVSPESAAYVAGTDITPPDTGSAPPDAPAWLPSLPRGAPPRDERTGRSDRRQHPSRDRRATSTDSRRRTSSTGRKRWLRARRRSKVVPKSAK